MNSLQAEIVSEVNEAFWDMPYLYTAATRSTVLLAASQRYKGAEDPDSGLLYVLNDKLLIIDVSSKDCPIDLISRRMVLLTIMADTDFTDLRLNADSGEITVEGSGASLERSLEDEFLRGVHSVQVNSII